MFVAERSSIGIRLRRQLFADYPLDSVDEKASNNTLVYKFHGEWIMTGIKFDFLYGSSAQATICGIEIQVWQRVIALFLLCSLSPKDAPQTSAGRIHSRGTGASVQSGSLLLHQSVCIPILVTTFPEWLSGTEPLPCVRPCCVCSVLRAHVQFCRFDKVDATTDVQWHCNHQLPLWYQYFPAQSSLGAVILVYWIGKIVRTCAPSGSRDLACRTLAFLRARRDP